MDTNLIIALIINALIFYFIFRKVKNTMKASVAALQETITPLIDAVNANNDLITSLNTTITDATAEITSLVTTKEDYTNIITPLVDALTNQSTLLQTQSGNLAALKTALAAHGTPDTTA